MLICTPRWGFDQLLSDLVASFHQPTLHTWRNLSCLEVACLRTVDLLSMNVQLSLEWIICSGMNYTCSRHAS